jgi:hypothetical protein
VQFTVTLTNEISGPAAAATASMVELRGSISAADAALQSFQGSNAAAAAGLSGAMVSACAASTASANQYGEALDRLQGRLDATKGSLGKSPALKDAAGKLSPAAAEVAKKSGLPAAKLPPIVAPPAPKVDAKKPASPSEAKPSAAAANKGDGGAAKLSTAAKGATIALAAMAAGLAVAGLKMGLPLALGYKGMAKMQMISARLSLDVRKLFSGVDPAPIIRAAEKFATLFSKTTSTGRVLSDVIGRIFNGLFGFFEAAEPYAAAFFQGLIFGFLTVENAYLKVRIASLPFLGSLNSMVGAGQLMKVAFYGGAVVLGLVALAAVTAVAPFVALGLAIEKVIGLYNEWTGNTVTLKKVPKSAGAGTGAAPDAGKAATPAADATGLAGQAAGAAMGDGLVKGITDKLGAATAAGAALAKAADTGVKGKSSLLPVVT